MENAAKALTIAGGVLIALIIVATLWYSFKKWGLIPQNNDNSQKISQDIAFNIELESYDKQNLYGSDVVTVLNKAIANNERYGVTADISNPYFIDVIIKTNSDISKVKKTYTRDENGVEKVDPPSIEGVYLAKNPSGYSLSSNYVQLAQLCKGESIKVTETKRGKVYTREEIYPGESEFRGSYFTCEEMQKDANTGRIHKIIFTQVSPDDLYDVD